MSTQVYPLDYDTRVISERVLFNARACQLAYWHDDDSVVALLSAAQTSALCLLSDAPYVIVMRRAAVAVCIPEYGNSVAGDVIDAIVQGWIDAFKCVDPSQAYVRVLPRLGYVLIRDAIATGA